MFCFFKKRNVKTYINEGIVRLAGTRQTSSTKKKEKRKKKEEERKRRKRKRTSGPKQLFGHY